MTVVIGVVTAAVVPGGVVTVTAVIGVPTVTAATTVTGSVGIGSVGTETVGIRSVEDDCDGDAAASAVDERTGSGVAARLEPCFGAGAAGPILELPAVWV